MLLALYRIVSMVRLSSYDARIWAVLARAPQLFRVTFTHINRLTPTLLPANYNCGSIVAIEPVMCRKSLRRLPGPEPPLGAACAMAIRHTLILPNL